MLYLQHVTVMLLQFETWIEFHSDALVPLQRGLHHLPTTTLGAILQAVGCAAFSGTAVQVLGEPTSIGLDWIGSLYQLHLLDEWKEVRVFLLHSFIDYH